MPRQGRRRGCRASDAATGVGGACTRAATATGESWLQSTEKRSEREPALTDAKPRLSQSETHESAMADRFKSISTAKRKRRRRGEGSGSFGSFWQEGEKSHAEQRLLQWQKQIRGPLASCADAWGPLWISDSMQAVLALAVFLT